MASTRPENELLAAAGFIEIDEVDATGEFIETARAWLRHSAEFEPALRVTLGDELFDQQVADRTGMVRAAEEGLLKRSLHVGTSPS